MNIIFCAIDTLRYDFIRAYGVNEWLHTPNLDRLAARSILFDNAWAASYPTIPHRTDIMTGEYAWEGQGPFHPWMPLRFDVPTLPRLLAEQGYATQLIHDTPHLVNGGHAFDWPFAAWTFVRGAEVDRPWIDDRGLEPLSNWARDPVFDFVDEQLPPGTLRRLRLTYSRAHRNRQRPEEWNAARLFQRGAAFLRDNTSRGDTREGSFFLWLDCFDPHEPWDVPPEFVKLYVDEPGYDGRVDPRAFTSAARRVTEGDFPPGVRERQLAYYAGKVSWVDHWFGHLLDALEETGLDENTAIVLTADHGTNLGERGTFGKTWIVNEQEAHVPLLIAMPGHGAEAARRQEWVQPQDIFATILGMAGVTPPQACVGHDLLSGPAPERELVIAGRSVNSWENDPNHILFSVFAPSWYLNLAADPAACHLYRYNPNPGSEITDEAVEHPEVVAELRAAGIAEAERRGLDPRLAAWIRREGRGEFPTECTAWPGPPGWRTYWERVYEE